VLVVAPASSGRQAADEITREKIFAAGPAWQEKYDQYEPPAEMLDALKTGLAGDVKIDVYLGLWCPDSRNNVPPFIKILDGVGNGIPVRFFDVPRKASRDVKYYVEELNVERVPTFIVYREGKEIGRIKENPKAGMLEDLMDIVLR
jgi:hypothetical protein